jgi:hypothetical protein
MIVAGHEHVGRSGVVDLEAERVARVEGQLGFPGAGVGERWIASHPAALLLVGIVVVKDGSEATHVVLNAGSPSTCASTRGALGCVSWGGRAGSLTRARLTRGASARRCV